MVIRIKWRCLLGSVSRSVGVGASSWQSVKCSVCGGYRDANTRLSDCYNVLSNGLGRLNQSVGLNDVAFRYSRLTLFLHRVEG
jgi:hypothetical protein